MQICTIAVLATILWATTTSIHAADKIYEVKQRGGMYTNMLDALAAVPQGVPFTDTHRIRVFGGVYSNFISITTAWQSNAGHPLVIEAATNTRPVMKDVGIQLNKYVNNVEVNGLVFTNALIPIRLLPACSYITIRNCEFLKTGNRAIWADGVNGNLSNLTIHDCIFRDGVNEAIFLLDVRVASSIQNNIFINNAAALNLSRNSPNVSIFNNIICENRNYGIGLGSSPNCVVYNNTFWNNGGSALGGVNNPMVQNNILGSTKTNTVIFGNTTITSDNNCFWVTNGATVAAGVATIADWQAAGHDAGSISGAPQFVDPLLHDYRIYYTSPCVDKGINLAGSGVTKDFEGDARPKFKAYDIGADECEVERNAPIKEIAVLGNGMEISSGDTTPAADDGTDFGDVLVHSSADQVFVIANSGDTALTLTNSPPVRISGWSEFKIATQPATNSVGPRSNVTFAVRFAPANIGRQVKATINIASDDANENPYTFTVSATAVRSVNGMTLLVR